MLSIGKSNRYFFYARDADMRKGFDGLCGLVSNEFLQNPLSGDVFIFLSRRRSRIKLLQFQGDGFAIFSKRLEKGTYEFPQMDSQKTNIEITSQQLILIMEGISLSAKKRVRYEHHFVGNSPMGNAISMQR
jgi:transposase